MPRPPRPRRGPAAARLLAVQLLAVPLLAVGLVGAGHPALAAAPGAAPLAAAPGGAAPAGPQTFGVQPASETKPDARSRFTYSVTPGAKLVDHLAVRNYSAGPLRLQVYAADAFNTPDGGFDLLAAGKRSTGVGAWAQADVPHVVVPSKGTAIVAFRVTVPANATPGDHAGGIVASLRTIRSAGNGKKVAVEGRVGARIYLRVAGPLHGELRVEDYQASYTGTLNPVGHGSVQVGYLIHNVGNVRLSGHQTVRVSGWFGHSALAGGLPEVPELLPGGSMRVSVTVPRVLPAVRLTVTAQVDPRPQPGDVDPRLAPAVASAGLLAFPWTFVVTVVAVVGIAVVAVMWRRPRRTGVGSASGGPSRAAARASRPRPEQTT